MKYLKSLDVKMKPFDLYIKEGISQKEKDILDQQKEETEEINRQLRGKIKEEKEEEAEKEKFCNIPDVSSQIINKFTISNEDK